MFNASFIGKIFFPSFPYYKFNHKNDRDMVLTSGSTLYTIFSAIVSPAFCHFDHHINVKAKDGDKNKIQKVKLWDTTLSTCGYSMMTLNILRSTSYCQY